ncbi:MAG: glycosyltransferase family 4 protein [Conexivisphaerales archaeon]
MVLTNTRTARITFVHTSSIFNMRGSEQWLMAVAGLLASKNVRVKILNFDYDRRFVTARLNANLERISLNEKPSHMEIRFLRGFRLRFPYRFAKTRGFLSQCYEASRFFPLSRTFFRSIKDSDLVYFVQCQRHAKHLLPVLFVAALAGRKNVLVGIHVKVKPTTLDSFFLRLFSRIGILKGAHVLSRDITGYISRNYGCRAYYIPNAIDPKEFYQATEKDDSEFRILYVGALTDVKGANLLPSIYLKLKSLSIPFKLYVCTQGGPLMRELYYFASVHRDDFILVGFVDHIKLAYYYNRSHVVIVPSRREQFPLVPLEAQACGTPVVGFDIPGLRQCVLPSETGFLAKKGDVDDLVERITYLYNLVRYDRGRYEKITMAATRFVYSNFSWGVVLRLIIRLFNSTIDKKAQL